jgi:hypothetical protein
VLLGGLIVGCGASAPPVANPPPPVIVSRPLVQSVTDHDDYEGRIACAQPVEPRSRVKGHLTKINFKADGLIAPKSAAEPAVQAGQQGLPGWEEPLREGVYHA